MESGAKTPLRQRLCTSQPLVCACVCTLQPIGTCARFFAWQLSQHAPSDGWFCSIANTCSNRCAVWYNLVSFGIIAMSRTCPPRRLSLATGQHPAVVKNLLDHGADFMLGVHIGETETIIGSDLTIPYLFVIPAVYSMVYSNRLLAVGRSLWPHHRCVAPLHLQRGTPFRCINWYLRQVLYNAF